MTRSSCPECLRCVTEDYCPTTGGYPTTDAEGRFSLTVANPPAGAWRAYYEGRDKQFRPARSTTVVVP